MKKIVSIFLVVVVIFNFMFCNKVYSSFGEGSGVDSFETDSASGKSQNEITKEGNAGGIDLIWGLLGNIFGTIAGLLAVVLDLFPIMMQTIFSATVGTLSFTIEDTVFDMYGLFNIDYFNFNKTYTIGNQFKKNITADSAVLTLRESVAQNFILTRLIATTASLVILIYVGIRMALSSLASDKAKYKKMLLAWFESIIMLFLMQYIIAFMFGIGKACGNVLYDLKNLLNGTSFEQKTIDKIFGNMLGSSGWTYALYSVVYWFLVFIQLRFYMTYLKRQITVGFLILISPLITITYPIDKIGDGKAQAFIIWFNELSVNILIQPLHALLYLVIMYTAGDIAEYSIIIASFFLLGLTKVEKVVLKLFNLKNLVSIKAVDEKDKEK